MLTLQVNDVIVNASFMARSVDIGNRERALTILVDEQLLNTIRYDTIVELFNVDSKAEYAALSSTRSQKKKLKQTPPVPL